jgi:dTDP-4-amino-4,6-dideoxygalactose transaminase
VNLPSSLKARQPNAPVSKPKSVPLLDLTRQYAALREEILAAIERVCVSQRFILGEEVDAFEKEVAQFVGTTAAVGCASGTDALWLALTAVGIKPGDEVITTAFSFFASVSAIVRCGARPVIVDIDPKTFNIDPVQAKKTLRARGSEKIRALLPVHLYGQCADMDALQQLADEFKLPIVEDAAQAIGAAWHGRSAGSRGATAAFSFYPSKNLSAYGEAGLVTTNSMALAERMRRLRNHGSPQRYYHEEIGWNSRPDTIQAAVLRVKLPHVRGWNERRQKHAAFYSRLLTDAGLVSKSSSPAVRTPFVSPHANHVFHQYVIRAERRDDLRRFLTARNIGTEVYYPLPLHLQSCFAYLGYQEGDMPESERAAKEVLALPMFPELTEEEQRWVVKSIAEFYS